MELNLDKFITSPTSPSLFQSDGFLDLDFAFPHTFDIQAPVDLQQPAEQPISESVNPSTDSPPSTYSYTSAQPPSYIENYRELTEISSKSKKIQKTEKRDKAKQRAKLRADTDLVLTKAAKKYIPPALEDPNLDDKTRRHLIQKVKNRMAAQKTRDEKKKYVNELEEVRARLAEETKLLYNQNTFLMQKVRALEEAQSKLMIENYELRRRNEVLETQFVSPIPMQQENSILLGPENIQKPANPNGQDLENPMIIRKPSGNKNCFGYFFTFTTLLAIFYTVRITTNVSSDPYVPNKTPIGPGTDKDWGDSELGPPPTGGGNTDNTPSFPSGPGTNPGGHGPITTLGVPETSGGTGSGDISASGLPSTSDSGSGTSTDGGTGTHEGSGPHGFGPTSPTTPTLDSNQKISNSTTNFNETVAFDANKAENIEASSETKLPLEPKLVGPDNTADKVLEISLIEQHDLNKPLNEPQPAVAP